MKHAQDGDKAVTHLDHAWIGGGPRKRHLDAIAAAHGAFRRRHPQQFFKNLRLVLPFIADGMLHPEDKQAIREMGFEEIRFDRCQPSYIITVEEV